MASKSKTICARGDSRKKDRVFRKIHDYILERLQVAVMRKAKPNFIRRKGKKLFGAAKDKVLQAEKNRARKRNRKRNAPRRRKNLSLTAAGQVLDALRGKNGKSRQNRRRRRNLDHRDAAHPIEVRRYWQGRKGYETPWQRAHKAGQKQLFAMNGRKRKGRNPAMLTLVNGAARRGRGRRRKNSDDLYQDFHGHPSTRDVQVYGPDGMPGETVMLGELDEIYYSHDGDSSAKGLTSDCLNFNGSCCLASNKGGNKYFIVSTNRNSLPRFDPNGEFGFATRVTYRARKDHLEGDSREHGYWHKLGEENGVLPKLCTDSEGLLVFRGGDYRTEPDGIIN